MSGCRLYGVGIMIPLMLMLAVAPVAAQGIGGDRAKQDEVKTEPDSEAEIPKRPILGRNRLIEVPSIADLFNTAKVGEELKLSPKAHEAILAAVAQATPNMTTLRNQLRNANAWMANGTGTQETLDQARSALEDVEAKRAEAVRSRLSRAQYKRLLQIALQQRGYRALTMPDVASAVALSPEQEETIKAILDHRGSERVALVERLMSRITPADEQRYHRILRKEISRQEITADEKAFMLKWFAAKNERTKRVEKFEDEIDARIFSVLRRYQKNRFHALVGDLVELEGPRAKPSEGSRSREEGQGGQAPKEEKSEAGRSARGGDGGSSSPRLPDVPREVPDSF